MFDLKLANYFKVNENINQLIYTFCVNKVFKNMLEL